MKRNIILSFIIGLVLVGVLFFRIYQKNATIISPASITPTVTTPLPKTSQGKIAFVSDRGGNQDIYSMDLDTLATENITNFPGNDMNPQVSANERTMVFYSNRTGNNQIYSMDLKTRNLTRLTSNQYEDYDPSFSPNGYLIVFKSTRDDGLGDILIMNSDGSNQVNLTPDRKDTEEWVPKFSADGKKIIFVSRANKDHNTDELYTMNIDGSDVQKITDNNVPDWYPSVNPVDDSIAYISRENLSGTENIFKLHVSDNKPVLLTNISGNNADPSWDAAGKRIVFINENDKDYDLYIMNADGTDERKIQDTPSNELSPIFLPNN